MWGQNTLSKVNSNPGLSIFQIRQLKLFLYHSLSIQKPLLLQTIYSF